MLLGDGKRNWAPRGQFSVESHELRIAHGEGADTYGHSANFTEQLACPRPQAGSAMRAPFTGHVHPLTQGLLTVGQGLTQISRTSNCRCQVPQFE